LELIYCSSGQLLFFQFKKTINFIWRVKSKKNGFLKTLLDRWISFGMILVLGFLFLVSLGFSILLNVMSSYIGQIAPDIVDVISDIFSFLLSFCIIIGFFGAIFKWLPDIDIVVGILHVHHYIFWGGIYLPIRSISK
jgi:membrane protein